MNDNGGKTGRIATLDLTKGVLVVCMVAYHALNYTTEYYQAFRYFAFLPPSFIVISGFLLSSIYPAKHSISDWRLHRRLMIRGTKLLLLFTGLNVLIQLTVARNVFGATGGLSEWWSFWFETYISGEGRTASFEVLLPICYLLLLSPVLLLVDKIHWLVLPLLTASVIGILSWSARHGGDWFHAQLMSAGLIGFLLGRIPPRLIGKLPRYTPFLFIGYLAYFFAGRAFGQSYLLQLTGAVTALALIYAVCARIDPLTPLGGRLELLGRYSLIAYIGQIGILQMIVRYMPRPEPFSPTFFLVMLGTLVLTTVVVEFTHWLQSRSSTAGGVYKAVFA